MRDLGDRFADLFRRLLEFTVSRSAQAGELQSPQNPVGVPPQGGSSARKTA
jgi:hypothetical protein